MTSYRTVLGLDARWEGREFMPTVVRHASIRVVRHPPFGVALYRSPASRVEKNPFGISYALAFDHCESCFVLVLKNKINKAGLPIRRIRPRVLYIANSPTVNVRRVTDLPFHGYLQRESGIVGYSKRRVGLRHGEVEAAAQRDVDRRIFWESSLSDGISWATGSD